jgi:hypothetical protein
VAKAKRPLSEGLSRAIGGALVDFEQQIFRGRPRVEERFQRRDEVSLAAGDGGTLVVGLPEQEGPPGPDEDESSPDPPGGTG